MSRKIICLLAGVSLGILVVGICTNTIDLNLFSNEKAELIQAVLSSNWDTVKKIITDNPTMDLNIPIKGHASYPLGFSPLSIAARMGNLEMVQFLVGHGAKVDMHGPFSVTALVAAVGKPGNIDVVRFLVEHGANINAGDRMSEATALDRAADDEIKNYLELHGAQHGPWYQGNSVQKTE